MRRNFISKNDRKIKLSRFETYMANFIPPQNGASQDRYSKKTKLIFFSKYASML